jgi:hypothetical protein
LRLGRIPGMGAPPAPDLPEVEARFQELPSRYRSLRQACEANVVSWRWASDDLYDPRPLHFETHGYKKGRLLKQPPKKPASKIEYGFGADGLIHVARQHIRFDGYPDRLWFYETFYVRGKDEIEVTHFDYHPDKDPIFYGIGRYEDGRMRHWRVRAREGIGRDTYTWEGEKVVRIECEHAPVEKGAGSGPLVQVRQYEICYDAAGDIQEILSHQHHPREVTEVVYRRRPGDVTFADLLRRMRPALTQAVFEEVRRAGISERVYALVLAWDPGQQESLPPSIGIGLESERAAWLQEHGKDAKQYLWNPAEYQNFRDIASEAVEEACRPVNQECRLRDSWKEARRVLNEVARDLGGMDWTGVLATTEDFVAFAVDLELSEFRQNIKASARPEVLEALKRKGWLLP